MCRPLATAQASTLLKTAVGPELGGGHIFCDAGSVAALRDGGLPTAKQAALKEMRAVLRQSKAVRRPPRGSAPPAPTPAPAPAPAPVPAAAPVAAVSVACSGVTFAAGILAYTCVASSEPQRQM